MTGHAAAVLQAHADAQMLFIGRAADRVRAPHFLAVDRRTHAKVLAWREAKRIAQPVGYVERDAHGVAPFRLHLDNLQWVVGQMHLK